MVKTASETGVEKWRAEDNRWTLWMAAAQHGDKKSYEKLLNETSAAIKQYLNARFGPVDFVDDITQECLLSIHRGRHTFDAKRPFRAWMFAIVRHCSVDYFRRQPNTKTISEEEIDPDSQPHPLANEIMNVTEASLILSKLNDKDRDVIVLVKYLGYSSLEASTQLGISVSAVRVRLHRAINQTRRLLGEEDLIIL